MSDSSSEFSGGDFTAVDPAAASAAPACAQCGRATRRRTVKKEGKTHGKVFFSCVSRACGGFQWEDPAMNKPKRYGSLKCPGCGKVNPIKADKVDGGYYAYCKEGCKHYQLLALNKPGGA